MQMCHTQEIQREFNSADKQKKKNACVNKDSLLLKKIIAVSFFYFVGQKNNMLINKNS